MSIESEGLQAEQLRIAAERADKEARRQSIARIASEEALQKKQVRDNDYGLSNTTMSPTTGELSGPKDWGSKDSLHQQVYEYYPADAGQPNVPMWHPGDKPIAKEPAAVSGPTAPPVPSEADRLKAYMAQFGSGGGGMYARLNSDQTGGYQEQRAGVQSMTDALAAEDENKRVARAGIQDLGAKYVTDLGLAQKKQQDLIDQRKSAIAEESRANKEAEGSFDSMRLTRKLGENPVSSAVMSFMAGLVGSLKGAAGDTSPNMVLGEVDKAVERDVMNQKVQYERMRNGQDSARTNFTDEMKMGATEQEALLAATTASVGQHLKALEYAGARIGDAQAKAKVLIAAGELRSEYGKLRYNADVKKAAAANAAAAQRLGLAMQWRQAEEAARGSARAMTSETATKYAGVRDPFAKELDAQRVMATIVGDVAKLTPQALKAAFEHGFANLFADGLTKGMDDKDTSAWAQTLQGTLAAGIKNNAFSDEQRAAIADVQRVVNGIWKLDHGGTITRGESVNAIKALALGTEGGIDRFIDYQVRQSYDRMRGFMAVAHGNPELENLMVSVAGPQIMGLWDNRQSNTGIAAGFAAAPTAGKPQ